MANYEPPTENLPIFDSGVFNTNDTAVTIAYANKHYLKFPNAQGTENLATINVSGLATMLAGVNINDGSNYSNIDMIDENLTIQNNVDSGSIVFKTNNNLGVEKIPLILDGDGNCESAGGFIAGNAQLRPDYLAITNETGLTVIQGSSFSYYQDDDTYTTSNLNVVNAANGVFTNQVEFQNYVPHCDILATQNNDLTNKSYVDAIVGSNSGTGIQMYLDQSMASDISGFKTLTSTYYYGEALQTVTTTALGTNLVSSFMSVDGVPRIYGSTLNAGLFSMNLYAYVSALTGTLNMYFTINKYDTLTSTITLLAISGNSSDVNVTTSGAPGLYNMTCSFPTTSFLTTDRLLIRIYSVGVSMGGGVTLSTLYEGSYYSYVLTPISQGSSSSLTSSNNIWTGTNEFSNTLTANNLKLSPVDTMTSYPTNTTINLTQNSTTTNNQIIYLSGTAYNLSDVGQVATTVYIIFENAGITLTLLGTSPNFIECNTGSIGASFTSTNPYQYMTITRDSTTTNAKWFIMSITPNWLVDSTGTTSVGISSTNVYIGNTACPTTTLEGQAIAIGNNSTTTAVTIKGPQLYTPATVGQRSGTTVVSLYSTALGELYLNNAGAYQTHLGNTTGGTRTYGTLTTAGTTVGSVLSNNVNLYTTSTGSTSLGDSSSTVNIGKSAGTVNISNIGTGNTVIGNSTGTTSVSASIINLNTPLTTGKVKMAKSGNYYTEVASDTGITYLDFHSYTTENDYDARIHCVGGSSGSSGKGTLEITATGINLSTPANTGIVYLAKNGNYGIECRNDTNVCYFDFHTSNTGSDYDARIIGSGGSGVIGQGTLEFYALTTYVGGNLSVNQVTLNTAATASNQLGYTIDSNTQISTSNQTAIATYTVYGEGSGAFLSQLLQGRYLVCVNGALIFNASAVGSVNSMAVQFVMSTTNNTATSSAHTTLLNPGANQNGGGLTAVFPYCASQVVTIVPGDANKWFGVASKFSIGGTFTTGSVKMVIDSFSITRIG